MKKAIHIRNLTKVYGAKKALDSIDLDISEGDFFGLLGPNGAGKSTTIGILTGLVQKTSGRAEVFGHETTDQYRFSRYLIGVVPQEFNFDLFQEVEKALLTVASYFGISRKDALVRIDELLEMMELSDKRHESIMSLSGGMKRRLLIVRALLHSPKILILDEPTAGVDVDLRRKVWEFVKKLNRAGTTILLTTHYLEEAEALCNRIAIIDHGKILLNENREEILNRLQAKDYLVTFAAAAKIPARWGKEFLAQRLVKLEALELLGTEVKNAYRFHFPEKHDLARFLKESVRERIEIEEIFAEKERLEDFFVRFLGKGKKN